MTVWDHRYIACPACNSQVTAVKETRGHGGSVIRRRKCERCDFSFYTAEVVADASGRPLTELEKGIA